MLAGKLRIKARCLRMAIVETGYVVVCTCLCGMHRFVLHFYNKDGVIRSGVVQAGYGRRDILECIENLERCVSDLKLMRKHNFEVLMS